MKRQNGNWPIVVRSDRNWLGAALQAWYREHPVSPAVWRMVSATAWRLSRRVVDGATLRADLEQLLLLAVCRAADRWDPAKGAYLSWTRGAIDFESRRIADDIKRRSGRWAKTIWLDAMPNEAACAVVDLLPVNGVQQMVSGIDIRAFAETLPPCFREVLGLLVQGWRRSDIAHFMDLPRSTFERKVWAPFVKMVEVFYA